MQADSGADCDLHNNIKHFSKMYVNPGTIGTVAGGGDTISMLNHAKASDYFSFISTGGGAFLEFIQGSGLPGLDSLND